MELTVIQYESIERFWPIAASLLTADPVRHTVALSLTARMLRGAQAVEAVSSPLLLGVFEAGQPIGVGICTPPFPITVSALPARAAGPVVDFLLAHDYRPSGVSGTRPEVKAFGAAWAERTGDTLVEHMAQLLYRLGELVPPTTVPGHGAPAIEDADSALLIDWRQRFFVEADGGTADQLDFGRQVRRSFAAGSAQVLWRRPDGEPVALACVGQPAGLVGNTMSRIGPVYTPPEHRGHGYGSAVTAAASRWALDQGAAHVVLFTDLSNPVSNSIYRRIGYQEIGPALHLRFEPNQLT